VDAAKHAAVLPVGSSPVKIKWLEASENAVGMGDKVSNNDMDVHNFTRGCFFSRAHIDEAAPLPSQMKHKSNTQQSVEGVYMLGESVLGVAGVKQSIGLHETTIIRFNTTLLFLQR
jgi:hypothetical protein